VQLHAYHLVSLVLIVFGVILCSIKRQAPLALRTEAV
jgi:hypothetical protein